MFIYQEENLLNISIFWVSAFFKQLSTIIDIFFFMLKHAETGRTSFTANIGKIGGGGGCKKNDFRKAQIPFTSILTSAVILNIYM